MRGEGFRAPRVLPRTHAKNRLDPAEAGCMGSVEGGIGPGRCCGRGVSRETAATGRGRSTRLSRVRKSITSVAKCRSRCSALRPFAMRLLGSPASAIPNMTDAYPTIGDCFWLKLKGFPRWPAKVCDPKDGGKEVQSERKANKVCCTASATTCTSGRRRTRSCSSRSPTARRRRRRRRACSEGGAGQQALLACRHPNPNRASRAKAAAADEAPKRGASGASSSDAPAPKRARRRRHQRRRRHDRQHRRRAGGGDDRAVAAAGAAPRRRRRVVTAGRRRRRRC